MNFQPRLRAMWYSVTLLLLGGLAILGISLVTGMSILYLALTGRLILLGYFLVGTIGSVFLATKIWRSRSKIARSIGRVRRFSLRTLFVISTLVGLTLWILLHGLHIQELMAVKKLQRAGAEVELIGIASTWNESLWIDTLLRSNTPAREYRVRKIPAAMLGELLQLGKVVELSISDAALRNADLEFISQLSQLRRLDVGSWQCTQLTDSGIKWLSRLQNLSVLKLHAPGITDAGIQHLSGLENLQHLHLFDTLVTDASLAHIGHLKSLRGLSIISRRFTGTGLSALTSLTELHWLDFRGTAISDMSLEELKKCEQVTRLQLDHTSITDVGLKHLASLKELKRVSLESTRVTPAGIAELQSECPSLTITN